MRLVDAVVDQPDLDALPRRGEGLPPERRGADQGRSRVRRLGGARFGNVAQRVIRHRRPDGRARQRAQARQIGLGEDDRDAVERDPVVPADAGCRNRHGEPRRECALRRGQRPEVGDRRRRAHGHGVTPSRRGCERPVACDLHRERGSRERHDDLDELRRRSGSRGRRSSREQSESRSEGERKWEQGAVQEAAWYVRSRGIGRSPPDHDKSSG